MPDEFAPIINNKLVEVARATATYPIVGYRIWAWVDDHLHAQFGWSPVGQWPICSPMEAKFDEARYVAQSIPHQGPALIERTSQAERLAKTGIHAYNMDASVLREYADPKDVRGEVYLWGKVIEHEYGYRAEFAYPKTIYLVRGCAPAIRQRNIDIARIYGCETKDVEVILS